MRKEASQWSCYDRDICGGRDRAFARSRSQRSARTVAERVAKTNARSFAEASAVCDHRLSDSSRSPRGSRPSDEATAGSYRCEGTLYGNVGAADQLRSEADRTYARDSPGSGMGSAAAPRGTRTKGSASSGRGHQGQLQWLSRIRSLGIERIPVTVNHFTVLRDRHVDARTAFSVGNFDALWHRIGILPAVFHRFEAKTGSIHAGVLGALFWRHLFKSMGEFHQASLFSFRRPQCVSFPVESTPNV